MRRASLRAELQRASRRADAERVAARIVDLEQKRRKAADELLEDGADEPPG